MISPLTNLPVGGGNASPLPADTLRQLTTGRLLLDATLLPDKMPALALGELVNARVAEKTPDGQLAVLIKNGLFSLKLPDGAQISGDRLQLRVASVKPDLTFALIDQSEKMPEVAEGSVDVKLSRTSRYLSDMLLAGRTAGSARSFALDADQHPPEKIAENLKQGVEKSGLFYESHLREWEEGQRPLAQIREEPQNRLHASHERATPPQDKALPSLKEVLFGKATDSDPVPERQAAKPVPELGQLLQRQLDTLETRQVQVQGFAWPGQPVTLQVEQEKADEREASGEEGEQTVWSTRLSLDLPVLGGLRARLRMVGGAVQVTFMAEETSAGDLISQHGQRLQDGMAAAGLTLASLTVQHDE